MEESSRRRYVSRHGFDFEGVGPPSLQKLNFEKGSRTKKLKKKMKIDKELAALIPIATLFMISLDS
jgi:hypothetical protein